MAYCSLFPGMHSNIRQPTPSVTFKQANCYYAKYIHPTHSSSLLDIVSVVYREWWMPGARVNLDAPICMPGVDEQKKVVESITVYDASIWCMPRAKLFKFLKDFNAKKSSSKKWHWVNCYAPLVYAWTHHPIHGDPPTSAHYCNARLFNTWLQCVYLPCCQIRNTVHSLLHHWNWVSSSWLSDAKSEKLDWNGVFPFWFGKLTCYQYQKVLPKSKVYLLDEHVTAKMAKDQNQIVWSLTCHNSWLNWMLPTK